MDEQPLDEHPVGQQPPEMSEAPLDAATAEAVGVPERRSVGGFDLLIGVAIIWAVELGLGVAVALAILPKPLSDFPLAVLALSLVGTVVTFGVTWFFVCGRYHKGFREGFALLGVPTRTLVWSLGIGAVASVAATILLSHFPEGDSLMARLVQTPKGLAVVIALALVLPPFEELYYRGFIFPVLARKLGPTVAVGLVTIWFAAAHAPQLSGTWIGVVPIFIMGLIWTVLRHRTGSLVPSLVCHMAYNIGLVALSLLALSVGN